MFIGLASPLLAAEAVATTDAVSKTAAGSGDTLKPAEACLSDLRAFNTQIDKDGF